MFQKFGKDVPQSLIDAVAEIMGEAKVEPAAPDREAIERRKRLQALKDKQEDERAAKADRESDPLSADYKEKKSSGVTVRTHTAKHKPEDDVNEDLELDERVVTPGTGTSPDPLKARVGISRSLKKPGESDTAKQQLKTAIKSTVSNKEHGKSNLPEEVEELQEGSTSKEKQKTPYRDINSPEYRDAANKQLQQMAKDKAAEPGKKLLDKIKTKNEEFEELDEAGEYDAQNRSRGRAMANSLSKSLAGQTKRGLVDRLTGGRVKVKTDTDPQTGNKFTNVTLAKKKDGSSTRPVGKAVQVGKRRIGLSVQEEVEYLEFIETVYEMNEEQLDDIINEVLGKDASAGDWISDFTKSDNPKFAGKSKAQRKKMALAAYYAKQRNEEVEEVEEELKGNQHKIDANKNGKVDAHDFKLLRAKKKVNEEDEFTHKVVHIKTGNVVGKYKSQKQASRAADKADNKYGAVAHRVVPISEESDLDESRGHTIIAKKLAQIARRNPLPQSDKLKDAENLKQVEIVKQKDTSVSHPQANLDVHDQHYDLNKKSHGYGKVHSEEVEKKDDVPFDGSKPKDNVVVGKKGKGHAKASALAKMGLKKYLKNETMMGKAGTTSEEFQVGDRVVASGMTGKKSGTVKKVVKMDNGNGYLVKHDNSKLDLNYPAHKLAKEEVELDEEVKTTHEDPLVTVHDRFGLHTHANLSTANKIFGTDVHHTDVHKGPVTVDLRRGRVKFAISKHHAKAVSEDVELDEGLTGLKYRVKKIIKRAANVVTDRAHVRTIKARQAASRKADDSEVHRKAAISAHRAGDKRVAANRISAAKRTKKEADRYNRASERYGRIFRGGKPFQEEVELDEATHIVHTKEVSRGSTDKDGPKLVIKADNDKHAWQVAQQKVDKMGGHYIDKIEPIKEEVELDETAVLDKYIRSMGYDPEKMEKNKKVMFAKTNAYKKYATQSEAMYDGGQKGTQDVDNHMSPGATARG